METERSTLYRVKIEKIKPIEEMLLSSAVIKRKLPNERADVKGFHFTVI